MIEKVKLKNPWTPQDEGDHHPSMKEWWCFESLFKTLEDNRKWTLKTTMAYEQETPSCFIAHTLFDMTNRKCVIHQNFNDDVNKLSHKKNKVEVSYKKSSYNGLYPNYHVHIDDGKQEFMADIGYKAQSLPHWSAQNITNGFLPIGFDYYRYGWLLNCDISGKLNIGDKSYNIKGKGYLEHAYGNWSYKNPFQKLSGIKQTISIYARLVAWWLSQRRPGFPRRIGFATDNNIMGNDWFWGVFDNNWSVFYGNSMFWLTEGPAFGVLSITPDGKEFWDFCNVQFHYNKLLYIKKYDMYYPCDIELCGQLNDKKINLRVWMTTENFEYISPYRKGNFYKAYIICEMPGRIEGVYTDNERTVKLQGDCKIEIQRQPSILGHNSLKFDFLLPPKGVGMSVDLHSSHLGKKMFTKFQLMPYPKIKCGFRRINSSKINTKTKTYN